MRDIARLIIVLTLTCIVAAIALAKVYEFTKEPIAMQRRLAKLKAIEAVLPEHDNQPDKDIREFDMGGGERRVVYLGVLGERITGMAYEVKSGAGYAGEIAAILGLDPNGTIIGIEIVRHGETPGLGAKIQNPEFSGQFQGRSLKNTQFMLKKDGGDIDQVTGATISPRAVVKAIKEGLDFFEANRPAILGDGKS